MPTGTASWWRACLLGGALGDALGAPVEFLTRAAIRDRFGPAGITAPVAHEGRVGAITDDTQLTLFTAEGLLGAQRRASGYGIAGYPSALQHSYLRWLATQGETGVAPAHAGPVRLVGLLYGCADLHHRRAPGRTVLAALRSGRYGTRSEPLNTSKGCGGVMRAAPAALGGFDGGVLVAAVTHGHPTGYLAAGAFAEILRTLAGGADLAAGLDAALARLAAEPDGAETAAALSRARDLAGRREATIEGLGAGWTAAEALAMAVFAALRADGDLVAGLRCAVDHSGDSDSVGAIAGNLLGAILGEDALPREWLAPLEARDVIETVAADLAAGPPDRERAAEHAARYPYH